jgi:hypothetical protein
MQLLADGQNRLIEGQGKLLQAQGKLFQGQDKLFQGQDKLFQGQDKLFESHALLTARVDRLAELVVRGFTQVAERQAALETRVTRNETPEG